MAQAAKSRQVLLKPITAPKPYEMLANQLREAILRGEIAEGEALSPERELVAQTGLTRGSVREALRQLAVEGLVEARPGRFGGNVVRLPGRESMANAIAHFVRGRRLPLRTLHETRYVLEPAMAGLAAIHRTPEDLDELKSLHASLIAAAGSSQSFSLVNVKWHNTVARASHNHLLAGVLDAISCGVAVSTTAEEYDTAETRAHVIRIHARVMEAIESGDSELAQERMRQHIGAAHARAAAPGTTTIPHFS